MSPMPRPVLDPAIDRPAAARRFAERSRVQVRDVLTADSALAILGLLRSEEWDLSWRVRGSPHNLLSPGEPGFAARKAAVERLVGGEMPEGNGITYVRRLRSIAAGEDSDYGAILDWLNGPDFLGLAGAVTGVEGLTRTTADATLYEPGQFLSLHHDGVEEGRRLAFVLNLCAIEDWRPDWGGYLLFYNREGEVVEGFRPRFNSLNLFRVPQQHAIAPVAASAPSARYAISGWIHADPG